MAKSEGRYERQITEREFKSLVRNWKVSMDLCNKILERKDLGSSERRMVLRDKKAYEEMKQDIDKGRLGWKVSIPIKNLKK
jgi:hypothetical protein